MAGEAPAILYLTPEELTVLYEHLVPPPAALPYDDLLPRYSPEQRTLVLDVARRTLIARLLLDPTGEGVERLNPLALAAAGSTLLAENTLRIVRQTSAGESHTTDVYRLDDATLLMHSVVDEGIRQFLIFRDPDDYREAILTALGLDAVGEAGSSEALLDGDQFTSLVAHAQRGDSIGARDLLAAARAPVEAAEPLVETLGGPFEFRSMISGPDGGDVSPPDQSLTFLLGGGAVWVADRRSGGPTDNRLHLRRVNRSAAQRHVQAFLNPAA